MRVRLCGLRAWCSESIRWCAIALLLMIGFVAPSRADVFGDGDNTFAIDFVTIGDPGNMPDPDNNPNSYQGHPGVFPIGDVAYVYRMGKYEISREKIEKANALGNLGITLIDMTDLGGNGPDQPATGLNWFEAAKFVNWLNTSTGHNEAYKVSDGEFKVWQPTDVGYDPNNIFRNQLAQYFLPSVDEWYKAAFYDGKSGVYYQFPTGSDTPPIPTARGTTPGTVVYHQTKPAPVNEAGGLSPYGTMGQGGNIWEWEETEYGHTNMSMLYGLRGLRSGDWDDNDEHVSANYRNPFPPYVENQLKSFGFRVASTAEPLEPILVGDFNSNGVLDAADIDMIKIPSQDLQFDLNRDGVVTTDDRLEWVHGIANTWLGDATLDGLFNSADLVHVLQVGQFEDAFASNSGWASGDWNGDRDFTSGDLVLAFQEGGYEHGPRLPSGIVPEPSSLGLWILIGVLFAPFRTRPE